VRRRKLVVLGLLAACGLALTVQAAWIPAKAGLAQALFHRAWDRAQEGEARPAPWPWADTWPIARLSAPVRGRTVFVLAGASGRTLAFGPGHVDGTARPGTLGNSALAGHRDTHFAFLKELEKGELLELETADGQVHRYRVTGARVVHESDTSVLAPVAEERLTLITCHPFDAVVPGGAMRYVVTAAAVAEGEGPPTASHWWQLREAAGLPAPAAAAEGPEA
jgi:sortase A